MPGRSGRMPWLKRSNCMHIPISRKTHGVFDYVMSAVLIASPWMCGFSTEVVNRQIALILGIAVALYSLVTKYDLGMIGILPFAFHRFLDLAVGVFLGSAFLHIASGDRGGLVFAILGVMILFNTFTTERPEDTVTS